MAKNFVFQVIKGVVFAVVFALAGVLIFALFIKLFQLSSSVIMPVNQIIKILSVFFGVFFCIKDERGLLKGMTIGVIADVSTYLLFSAISGSIVFSWTTALEIVFSLIIGGICGVITQTIKK